MQAKPNKSKESFISRRAGVFMMGLGMVIFLACWTLPAFWEHLEGLGPSYIGTARVGALSGEFALLCFLLFHSWDKSLNVRKYSLVFGTILAFVLIIHAAALWGLKDGSVRQTKTEDRLTEKLGELSKQQGSGSSNRQGLTRAEV